MSNTYMAEVITGPLAWRAGDLQEDDWFYSAAGEVGEEISALVTYLRRYRVPILALRADDFDLPSCQELMGKVKRGLVEGCGFALVDRLPVEDMTKCEATAVYWILSQLICRPVAQKRDGTMIYDVHDTGAKAAAGSGVRPDKTNIDLNFHNDNCYNNPMPDFVGLLCLRPAKSGGVSKVMSFDTAHNALLQRHAELLPRLYQPFVFDRQREHPPGDAATIREPIFKFACGVQARLGIHQIRNGYEMTAGGMDDTTRRALDALEDVFAEETLQFSFPMKAGQFQYVNNRAIGHSRTQFEDFGDPDARRHLVRLWLRESGAPSYQG